MLNLFSPQISPRKDVFFTELKVASQDFPNLVMQQQQYNPKKNKEFSSQHEGNVLNQQQNQFSQIGQGFNLERLNKTEMNFTQNINYGQNKLQKYMKAYENASQRSLQRDQHYQELINQYDLKVRKIEDKIKEDKMYRRRLNKSQQIKRDKVKSQRDKQYENLELDSYRDYQENVVNSHRQNNIQSQRNSTRNSQHLGVLRQNHKSVNNSTQQEQSFMSGVNSSQLDHTSTNLKLLKSSEDIEIRKPAFVESKKPL
eukprot:403358659